MVNRYELDINYHLALFFIVAVYIQVYKVSLFLKKYYLK